MQLVTSLTADASLLRRLLRLWDIEGDTRNPFAAVLVTPLFADPSTLRTIREELRERRGATVYFDSGGYYVQQRRIAFEDLYCRLREWYRHPDNQWADWYVLPDHVPTSCDAAALVEQKVNETIAAARLFMAEMPSHLQARAIPVVQGHNFEQVQRCVDAFRALGVSYAGFGSFGTSAADVSINIPDRRSATLVEYLARCVADSQMRLHSFGISTPPAVYAFRRLGFHSFDSLGWQRSAGYGKVYLPFTRAYNVSHRSIRNSSLTREEFETLKHQTGHGCSFCQDFYRLSQDRLARSLHNLVVLQDTAQATVSKLQHEAITTLIGNWSPRYYKIFESVYRE